MANDLTIIAPSSSPPSRHKIARNCLGYPSVAEISAMQGKNALARIVEEPLSDLTPLFECSLAALAGNIRYLISEREKNKIALCQQLGVAKMRLASGDGGETISWNVWCKRLVLNSKGQPYPQSTCNKWAQIGLSADIQAAWREYKTKEKEQRDRLINSMPVVKVRYERKRIEDVLGPQMTHAVINTSLPAQPGPHSRDKAKILAENETSLQVRVLMHAWEAACPAAKIQFLHLVNARMLPGTQL